jgi:plastocyanin
MRQRARLAGVALLGALALAAGGCGGDEGGGGGGGGAGTTTGDGAGGGETIELTAQGVKWDKTTLDLKSGTRYTVRVSNQDSVEHNFTFKEAGAEQDVQANQTITVELTAPAAGSYEFVCEYHPGAMKGTVTVT